MKEVTPDSYMSVVTFRMDSFFLVKFFWITQAVQQKATPVGKKWQWQKWQTHIFLRTKLQWQLCLDTYKEKDYSVWKSV